MKFKRIISLLCSMILVLSLAPSAFLSASAASIPVDLTSNTSSFTAHISDSIYIYL